VTGSRLLLLAFLPPLVSLGWPQGARPTPKPGRPAGTAGRYAIVVGISDYRPATGLSRLEYAASDAQQLAQALEEQGYNVQTLTDAEASRGVLKSALENLKNAVGSDVDNELLFYFSGHGFAQNGKNYLATFGATATQLSEGLLVDDVLAALDQIPATTRMMLLDACRSDPFPGAKSNGASFSTAAATNKTAVLYSTSPGTASYEDRKLGGGVFTHFLLEGLKGAAKGNDSDITAKELSDYVVKEVAGYSFRNNRSQRPTIAGTVQGTAIIATATDGAAEAPKRDDPTTPAPASTTRPALPVLLPLGSAGSTHTFDSAIWQAASQASRDRIDLVHQDGRIRATFLLEDVQTSLNSLVESAINRLGGSGVVQILKDEFQQLPFGPVRSVKMRRAGNEYWGYYHSSNAGSLQVMVYGDPVVLARESETIARLINGLILRAR
jgi:uncharacterized caspase-like protein